MALSVTRTVMAVPKHPQHQVNPYGAGLDLEQHVQDCFSTTNCPYDQDARLQLIKVVDICKSKLHSRSTPQLDKNDSYRTHRDRVTVPLLVIEETLKEQGYQYGKGKNLPKQLQSGYLDCELSTLLYFLTLDRLQSCLPGLDYAPTSMHEEDSSSHVCVRSSRLDEEPLLWETSLGGSGLVSERDYQSKFASLRHHPREEIQNIPVSILVSHLCESEQNSNLFNWLDQVLVSPLIYPSPEFYSSAISELIVNAEIDASAWEQLYQFQTDLVGVKGSRSNILQKALLAMHIALNYQNHNQEQEALGFYQLALRDIDKVRRMKQDPSSTFAQGHCLMNLFVLTRNPSYRTQAIHNLKQLAKEPDFAHAARDSILELEGL